LQVNGATQAVAPWNPVPPHCSHCFANLGAVVVVVVAGACNVDVRLIVVVEATVVVTADVGREELVLDGRAVEDVTNVVSGPLPTAPFAYNTPLPLVPTYT